jgi:GT2 family glycosyltransferase
MKTLSIVVPVFNQVHLTRQSLKSMIEGSRSPHQLIVIDNNSTDETPSFLQEFKSQSEKKGWQFQIITNPKNVGVGSAFNQGIAASSSEFIILANNDTWLMPDWDFALVNACEKLNAAMVGAYYDETPFDDILTPQKAHKFVSRNRGKYSESWAAIVMCFRRSTFEKIGTFDEQYFVSYEDRDLRERMDRAGLKFYKTADCFIWHHSKGTRNVTGTQALRPNYEQESLAKFIAKWGFDPRPAETDLGTRYLKKWIAFKNRHGYF